MLETMVFLGEWVVGGSLFYKVNRFVDDAFSNLALLLMWHHYCQRGHLSPLFNKLEEEDRMWLLMLYICDHLLVLYIACSCFITQLALTSIIEKKKMNTLIIVKKKMNTLIIVKKEKQRSKEYMVELNGVLTLHFVILFVAV